MSKVVQDSQSKVATPAINSVVLQFPNYLRTPIGEKTVHIIPEQTFLLAADTVINPKDVLLKPEEERAMMQLACAIRREFTLELLSLPSVREAIQDELTFECRRLQDVMKRLRTEIAKRIKGFEEKKRQLIDRKQEYRYSFSARVSLARSKAILDIRNPKHFELLNRLSRAGIHHDTIAGAWKPELRASMRASENGLAAIAFKLQKLSDAYDYWKMALRARNGGLCADIIKKNGLDPNIPRLSSAAERGLLKAIDRLDDNRKSSHSGNYVRFSTAAWNWIRQVVQEEYAVSRSLIWIPRSTQELIRNINKYEREHGPTKDHLLVKPLNVSLKTITYARAASKLKITDMSVLDNADDAYVESNFTDPRSLERDGQEKGINGEFALEALEKLKSRERKVVALRFGLYGNTPQSLREIGEGLRISKERVRQIEARSLEKLNNILTDRGFVRNEF